MKINELRKEMFVDQFDYLRAVRLPQNDADEIVDCEQSREILARIKQPEPAKEPDEGGVT